MKRVYLDYAAATPITPEALAAMKPYFQKDFGNPGSLHHHGQIASAAVYSARRTIARILHCLPEEIIFTASATEANNLALRGVIGSALISRPKILISAIEHESILETARILEEQGAEVVLIPALPDGRIDMDFLNRSLDERTVLVSVMYVNNEIGTIQPIADIAECIAAFRKKHATHWPLFHTDAVQAFNYFSCRVDVLCPDLLTLSSAKLYGPKGIGLLYVASGISLRPLVTGGGQERGLRSGTENVPGIIGFAEAMKVAERLRFKESRRMQTIRDSVIKELKTTAPTLHINGGMAQRAPNNLNVYIPHYAAQDLLIALDRAGFSVATGSACSARAAGPSHVLHALGYSADRAKNSLRITMGRQTTAADMHNFLKRLQVILLK